MYIWEYFILLCCQNIFYGLQINCWFISITYFRSIGSRSVAYVTNTQNVSGLIPETVSEMCLLYFGMFNNSTRLVQINKLEGLSVICCCLLGGRYVVRQCPHPKRTVHLVGESPLISTSIPERLSSTLPVARLIKNTNPYNWFADESGFIINAGNCPGPNSIISREFILRILSIFSQQSPRMRLMRRQELPIIASIKKPFSSANAIWEHSIFCSHLFSSAN